MSGREGWETGGERQGRGGSELANLELRGNGGEGCGPE